MFLASLTSPFPALPALGLGVLLALSGATARSQETTLVSLKDALNTEVQERTFTLAKAMKVHVYAKGGGTRQRPFYAYGWILNAATREVVWQMDGRNAKTEGDFQVSDLVLDLKAGVYEAYYSNHGFGWSAPFSRGTRGIDRRRLKDAEDKRDRDKFGFHAIADALVPGRIADWRARAGHYGIELYIPAAEAGNVTSTAGPTKWRGEVLALLAAGDDGEWRSAFKVSRPITLHVYCQGERDSGETLADSGWIIDARTHLKVWEMDGAKAAYAGGSEKNLRQVETLTLPAGEYLAGYSTDDSHSPAHWNAQPPCDPLRYGLILSLPREGDASAFSLVPAREPGKVLASLVRVGNHRREQATFTLPTAASVRVYALGEADEDEMADGAWITDAAGAKVWAMSPKDGVHAGGARKNRMQDKILALPAGTYTLHVQTDGSHAFGDWNSAPPRDAEHYGATVYAVE